MMAAALCAFAPMAAAPGLRAPLLLRTGVEVLLWLTLPVLGAAAMGGLVSAALATFTQLDDPAIRLLARVAAVAAALAMFGAVVSAKLIGYCQLLFAAMQATT